MTAEQPVIEAYPTDDVSFREFAEALILSSLREPEGAEPAHGLAIVRTWIRLAYPDATVECDCSSQHWVAYRDAGARALAP